MGHAAKKPSAFIETEAPAARRRRQQQDRFSLAVLKGGKPNIKHYGPDQADEMKAAIANWRNWEKPEPLKSMPSVAIIPMKTDDWERIELGPLPIEVSAVAARGGISMQRSRLTEVLVDLDRTDHRWRPWVEMVTATLQEEASDTVVFVDLDEGHLAALRDQLRDEKTWGPREAWAIAVLIGEEVYRWIYEGPLSRLQRYVMDEVTRRRLDQAGGLGLSEQGVPLRIQRVQLRQAEPPAIAPDVTHGSQALDGTSGNGFQMDPSAKDLARAAVGQFDVRAEASALVYKGVGLG